jgi:hypothetical protein
MEEPAMPIGPFHHRGNAEFALQIVQIHTFFRSLEQQAHFYDHTGLNGKSQYQSCIR